MSCYSYSTSYNGIVYSAHSFSKAGVDGRPNFGDVFDTGVSVTLSQIKQPPKTKLGSWGALKSRTYKRSQRHPPLSHDSSRTPRPSTTSRSLSSHSLYIMHAAGISFPTPRTPKAYKYVEEPQSPLARFSQSSSPELPSLDMWKKTCVVRAYHLWSRQCCRITNCP